MTGGVPAATVDLNQLKLQPGAHEYELTVAGQGVRSAEIWMPDAAAPRTLIIFLHGRVITKPGRRTWDAASQTRGLVACLGAPAFELLDPIIIAPRSPDGQWWHKSDTELVLGLVMAVRSRWPEAGARSVIAGYSNGGIGTWYFARLYPEYFSAAVPMAFNASIVGESELPIYAIQGTRDNQFDIAKIRGAIRDLKAKGQNVTLHEKHRGLHEKACSYVSELTGAGHWLEEHAFVEEAR